MHSERNDPSAVRSARSRRHRIRRASPLADLPVVCPGFRFDRLSEGRERRLYSERTDWSVSRSASAYRGPASSHRFAPPRADLLVVHLGLNVTDMYLPYQLYHF